jgi:TPP-dependent pyruvate/acetoin dehydrogenase alpha subunit
MKCHDLEKKMHGLSKFSKKKNVTITPEELQSFEGDIAHRYEDGQIKGPVHLSDGNEKELSRIFEKISPDDFVFSAWRNHYHALLHGVPADYLKDEIMDGRSMGIIYDSPNFFSSSIVGGIIPVALGTALGYKLDPQNIKHVWCFIGDMTYESGLFWEAYKMSRNHDLPLTFIIEDNGKSVTTDTKRTWSGKMEPLDGIIYYTYSSKYPHHGTGNWINF